MPEKYAPTARAALLQLMVEGRPVPNVELTREFKIELGRDDREALNKAGLLETTAEGRRLVHRITAEGIAWCEADLRDGEAPNRMGPLARVHGVVIRILARVLWNQGTLAEAFRSREELEDVIRRVYLELGDGYQDWVRLAKLRPRLDGAEREEVDETLLRMVKDGTTHLVPDSNRKVLTEEDHAAAIRIGGEDKHLVAIEES
ncbi:hypothetical protein BBK82_26730 [Lentzea guizhouensis]|uniref:Uncharacterized protein n=1 Tax=Lentzea guizhouensis TaxID=1586287 RepID=A0A1B2HN16_9PSEU|nr:hypothetical protein [Lentzea guizhouensis]ANZ39132.1 hypothetical protein BBK82_26730 [Lentzea guizhouensis]